MELSRCFTTFGCIVIIVRRADFSSRRWLLGSGWGGVRGGLPVVSITILVVVGPGIMVLRRFFKAFCKPFVRFYGGELEIGYILVGGTFYGGRGGYVERPWVDFNPSK